MHDTGSDLGPRAVSYVVVPKRRQLDALLHIRETRQRIVGIALGDDSIRLGETIATGDLFEALPTGLRGRVHVLLANVPYVPTDAIALMPPEARDHEARATLDGGPDGQDLMRVRETESSPWRIARTPMPMLQQLSDCPALMVTAGGSVTAVVA